MDIDEHLLRCGAQPFAYGLDDAPVGLVWNDALEPRDIDAAAFESAFCCRLHRLNCILEGFLAFHAQVMHAVIHGFLSGGTTASATGHEQQVRLAAIRPHDHREQAMRTWSVLQNGGSRAIAKQHTSIPVLPIDNAGELVRSDHQDGIIGARHDELMPHLQPVDETRAGGFHVKGRSAESPDLPLHQTRRGWKGHIRRDRGHNDQVNLVRRDSRVLHCYLSGFGREVRGVLILRGKPPFLNPGAGDNPVVRGVDHLLQVGICKNAGGHVRANAGYRASAP